MVMSRLKTLVQVAHFFFLKKKKKKKIPKNNHSLFTLLTNSCSFRGTLCVTVVVVAIAVLSIIRILINIFFGVQEVVSGLQIETFFLLQKLLVFSCLLFLKMVQQKPSKSIFVPTCSPRNQSLSQFAAQVITLTYEKDGD